MFLLVFISADSLGYLQNQDNGITGGSMNSIQSKLREVDTRISLPPLVSLPSRVGLNLKSPYWGRLALVLATPQKHGSTQKEKVDQDDCAEEQMSFLIASTNRNTQRVVTTTYSS